MKKVITKKMIKDAAMASNRDQRKLVEIVKKLEEIATKLCYKGEIGWEDAYASILEAYHLGRKEKL